VEGLFVPSVEQSALAFQYTGHHVMEDKVMEMHQTGHFRQQRKYPSVVYGMVTDLVNDRVGGSQACQDIAGTAVPDIIAGNRIDTQTMAPQHGDQACGIIGNARFWGASGPPWRC